MSIPKKMRPPIPNRIVMMWFQSLSSSISYSLDDSEVLHELDDYPRDEEEHTDVENPPKDSVERVLLVVWVVSIHFSPLVAVPFWLCCVVPCPTGKEQPCTRQTGNQEQRLSNPCQNTVDDIWR